MDGYIIEEVFWIHWKGSLRDFMRIITIMILVPTDHSFIILTFKILITISKLILIDGDKE